MIKGIKKISLHGILSGEYEGKNDRQRCQAELGQSMTPKEAPDDVRTWDNKPVMGGYEEWKMIN